MDFLDFWIKKLKFKLYKSSIVTNLKNDKKYYLWDLIADCKYYKSCMQV